jgi:hypothetical protein
MELMAAWGLADIAIWSYLATAYMSSHVCADSERVWQVVTQAMQTRRGAAPSTSTSAGGRHVRTGNAIESRPQT